MKDKNKRFSAYLASRTLLLCTLIGCVCLIAATLFTAFTSVSGAVYAVLFTALDLIGVSVVVFLLKPNADNVTDADLDGILNEKLSILLTDMKMPAFLTDAEGKVLWCNAEMYRTLGDRPIANTMTVDELFGGNLPTFAEGKTALFPFAGKLYRPEGYVVTEDGGGYYLTLLDDVTEIEQLRRTYENERCAVAYIVIDNVEDVLLYVHDKFHDAVSAVDEKIRAWAAQMNAVIKSYDNDKYIMFLSSDQLNKCIEDRFAILDHIRDTRVGDGVAITVSVGVSSIEGTLAAREQAARDAIDFALQRGGDQAVYKTESTVEYYGGRTKSLYKRSNVRSRTFTNELTSLIGRADNVLIMGHRYGDFDSFGASVGAARLAMLCGTKVNVAVDLRDKNLAPCIEMMETTPMYASVFVDNAAALDLITPDTLLILVDHNSPARSQFADVAEHVEQIAIIDHHRKTETPSERVKISYIEPSASSACELLSEMLESAISSQNLLKEEADMLLAGILLDTKQFTRNTGTRTFGAAQYLRGAGADPADVYDLFKTDPEELSKEARFHTSIRIYRDNIAIASCEGKTDDTYRVIASKAADKMLTLQGIEASFALVRIGNRIHISGRSNGRINVQLILEKLHGGGHFDVAGAQVEAESVVTVLEQLKASIDSYLDQQA